VIIRLILDSTSGTRVLRLSCYTADGQHPDPAHQGRLDADVNLITNPFTFDQFAIKVRNATDRGSP
jgi:hypothetical protein